METSPWSTVSKESSTQYCCKHPSYSKYVSLPLHPIRMFWSFFWNVILWKRKETSVLTKKTLCCLFFLKYTNLPQNVLPLGECHLYSGIAGICSLKYSIHKQCPSILLSLITITFQIVPTMIKFYAMQLFEVTILVSTQFILTQIIFLIPQRIPKRTKLTTILSQRK